MDNQTFIKKSKEIFKGRYNYSLTEYKGMSKDLILIDNETNIKYLQKPKSHLLGCIASKPSNQEETNKLFIFKAKEIHKDKYDYSLVEYINNYTPIKIICSKHGVFQQRPSDHLNNCGCPICAGWRDTNLFIKKAIEKHGNRYDYNKTNYVNASTKVEIVCPKHGSFWQDPKYHMDGGNCPKCGIEVYDTKTFIKKSNRIHNNEFNYSKVKYINNHTNVEIICPKHGNFWQTPMAHLSGKKGCLGCTSVVYNTETFVKKSKEVHGDIYNYDLVDYNGYSKKVRLVCPKHGEFEIIAEYHIYGSGCPRCMDIRSFDENEIVKFIEDELKINVKINDTNILNGKEIDILIPSHNLGIEYDGLYWHGEKNGGKSKKYHLNKTLEAKKGGINLIHIFEDEWLTNKELIKNKIKHLLGLNTHLPKIYARKTTINEISIDTKNLFLDKYHIQGGDNSSIKLGAFFEDRLVAVMTFVKDGEGYILNRFATNTNFLCVGVASKILKYFIRKYNPKHIKSYADKRWTLDENNNLYTKMGFKLDHISEPGYWYFKNSKMRLHRSLFMRKELPGKLETFDPSLTEWQNMMNNGYDRIWDCGTLVYVLNID